jgi:hypothetical protein
MRKMYKQKPQPGMVGAEFLEPLFNFTQAFLLQNLRPAQGDP